MQALYNLAKRAKTIGFRKCFVVVFKDPSLQRVIVELNRDQLRLGLLDNDFELPDYSRVSQDLFDKPDGPITLYDTGEFYESFRVEDITEAGFTITADDRKINDGHVTNLFEKYALGGGSVPGLTSKSLEILQDEALPFIIDYTLNWLLQDNK